MNPPVGFHPRVPSELRQALDYFEEQDGAELADRFYAEFLELVGKIAQYPSRYHFAAHAPESSGLRRANFRKFPYHILFRIRSPDIWISVLRHDKRHPGYGLNR